MNTFNGKKITRATVKSFICKAGGKLKIMSSYTFDGMQDCVTATGNWAFVAAKQAAKADQYNLGVAGAHFVGQGRDYFRAYNADGMVGIEVSNCCGSFTLAVEA